MNLRTYVATLVGATAAGALTGAALHHLNLLRLARRRAAMANHPAERVMTMTLDEFEQAFGVEAAAGIRAATQQHEASFEPSLYQPGGYL